MSNEDNLNINAICRMSRRSFVKLGAAAGAIALGGGALSRIPSAFGALPPETGCGIQEVFPTSPFIVTPFIDALPQLTTMRPGFQPDTLAPGQAPWTVRRSKFLATVANPTGAGVVEPGPGVSQQDVYGRLLVGDTAINGQNELTPIVVEHAGTHQVWPVPIPPQAIGGNFGRLINWPAAGVEPIRYHIRMKVGTHKFTSSKVRPIDKGGRSVPLPRGAPGRLINGQTTLPDSVVYGFNGTFPGALINVDYGKPAVVRFENDLDKNPLGQDRQNFGAPDFAFLTHLHNGHTAPESDGNPNYMQINEGGYTPGDWVDNLYLNYPAGGDASEIQSFLWFHDHRMHHTGANVYKGMVGLMPFYDPGIPGVPGTGLDTGNESDPAPNLKLPGVRTNNGDGSFDVKYDIHMALYDCALDDGITPHADLHTDLAACGLAHPEWWGKTFFKHFPNHGFVGDIFTVNCTAFPVLNVEQRRYRFRFLGASVARIYELALMTSAVGPVAMPGTQGQWQIPDGVQWKPWTLIANMGGLLPNAVDTNTFFIWPATRREVVVDFTGIAPGTVLYITNTLVMKDGRLPDFLGAHVNVPLVKIVVGGAPPVADASAPIVAGTALRPMPVLADGITPVTLASTAALPHKLFTLSRSGRFGEENSWLINDLPFDHLVPLTTVVRDQPEVWTNKNGGGGWVHPMHMHQEEHTTLQRIGSILATHPEDTGKEDVNNLEPGESVTFYRNFRTFEGRYVAHCHNLAHEDHNMMFGWDILAPPAVPGAFAVSGKVTDNAGKALPGVTIALTGALTTTTDDAGFFRIGGLGNGTVIITPARAGFAFAPTSISAVINNADVLNNNFVGTPVAVATFAISGTVTNRDARPLVGVAMTLTGAKNLTTKTVAGGNYSFAGLANGNYTVTPAAKGFTFVPKSRDVTIADADMPGQDFTTKQKKVNPGKEDKEDKKDKEEKEDRKDKKEKEEKDDREHTGRKGDSEKED